MNAKIRSPPFCKDTLDYTWDMTIMRTALHYQQGRS